MPLKLIALIVPLGLDTFAVAAALGVAGLQGRDRIRVSLLFTAFEVGMPLVGFFGGRLISGVAGDAADLLAIAILVAVAAYMLRPGGDQREGARLGLLRRTRGVAVIGLGISISLDELAIGFTIGLLGFPIVVILLLIGVQTFIVSQLGISLGQRVGERFREGAERLAGVMLGLLAVVLLVERFSGR